MRSSPTYRAGSDAHQRHWEREKLSRLPVRWAADVEREFRRQWPHNPWGANAYLRDESDSLRRYRLPLGISDAALRDQARACASAAFDLALAEEIREPERYYKAMGDYARAWGIDPPALQKEPGGPGVTLLGALARLSDPLWWRRRLRAGHARDLEGEAIRRGYVHVRAGLYASDEAVTRRAEQRQRNAGILAETVATNEETGQAYTLAELAEKSVANPSIRRGELMTRIAGFEAVAKGVGHVAEFVTCTAPSRYHARLSPGGAKNPRYKGETPRAAQGWLSRTWARVRAALSRARVAVYGFRVAEPHHDGTPHWHCLFFFAPSLVEQFRAILRRYWLADDGNEPGAQENRIKFVTIDWAKGTAAGYVAKYVAKNIDGHGVGLDFEDGATQAWESSRRVDAWAATWGIRQFQQIGGPPVGVWRELRRIEKGNTDSIERVRLTTGIKGQPQTANWGAFVMAMGGPEAKRLHMPVALAKRPAEQETKYGEPAPDVVFGVFDTHEGKACESRRYRWRIERKAAAWQQGGDVRRGSNPPAPPAAASPSVLAGCCDGPAEVAAEPAVPARTVGSRPSGFAVGPAFSAPWSPVNNCTGETHGSGNASAFGAAAEGGGDGAALYRRETRSGLAPDGENHRAHRAHRGGLEP